MALFTETWDGTAAGWPAQWFTVTSGAGTVVDRVSGYGRMATGTAVYGRCGALNITPLTSVDYELTVDLLVPILSEWYAYVHVRGADGLFGSYRSPSSYQLRFVGASGGVSCEFWQVDAVGTETYIRNGGTIPGAPGGGGGPASLPIVAGDVIRIKVYVSGAGPVTLREKAWVNTGIEPPYTDLSASVTTYYTGAYMALSAQGGNNTVSEDIKWDDLDITSLAPATQTMTLPLVTNTPSLFDPSVTPPPQAPVLPLVTSGQTLFAPTVALNLLAVIPLIAAPPTVFTPTVVPYGYAVLPLLTSGQTVFSPSAVFMNPTQTTVLPPVFVSTQNMLLDEDGNAILDEDGGAILLDGDGAFQIVYQTSAAVISGTQSPVLPLITSTQTVFDPAIAPTTNTVVPLVSSVETIFAPSLTQEDPHLLPLVVSTQTVFAFSVTTTGTLVAIAPLVTNAPSVFTPTVVAAITAVIEMPLTVVLPSVFAPTVSPATPVAVYTFEPPHDDQGPRQLSEYGRRRAGVSKVANQLSGYYGGPRSFSVLKLNGTYVTIQGPTMDQVDAATEYYAGGHIHEVDADIAAELEAAGYEVQGYP